MWHVRVEHCMSSKCHLLLKIRQIWVMPRSVVTSTLHRACVRSLRRPTRVREVTSVAVRLGARARCSGACTCTSCRRIMATLAQRGRYRRANNAGVFEPHWHFLFLQNVLLLKFKQTENDLKNLGQRSICFPQTHGLYYYPLPQSFFSCKH